MKEKNIKAIYLKKIKLIEKYNKDYYDRSKRQISDQEFDLLKKDIIDLEDSYKFLKSEYSPSKTVGFMTSKNFQKIKHKFPMLSLGNAFNEEDLKNFEKK